MQLPVNFAFDYGWREGRILQFAIFHLSCKFPNECFNLSIAKVVIFVDLSNMTIRRFVERLKTYYYRTTSRHLSLSKVFIIAICISLLTFIFLSYRLMRLTYSDKRANPPQPVIKCRFDGLRKPVFTPKDHHTHESVRIGKRVLVFVESQYTKHAKLIIATLEAARFEYKIENTGKSLPALTHYDKGRWSVIVFENLEAYINMDNWNRGLLDKYCQEYKVGMIIFVHSADEYGIDREKVPGFPLILRYNMALQDYRLNPFTELWRITRPGEVIPGPLTDDDWTVFEYNHSTYEPISYARAAPNQFLDPGYTIDNSTLVAALQDRGELDGIWRVYFGNGLRFWLHRLVFLDSLSYLSHGKLSLSLDRYIQVDVDDIFVGLIGTRMIPADVEVGQFERYMNRNSSKCQNI